MGHCGYCSREPVGVIRVSFNCLRITWIKFGGSDCFVLLDAPYSQKKRLLFRRLKRFIFTWHVTLEPQVTDSWSGPNSVAVGELQATAVQSPFILRFPIFPDYLRSFSAVTRGDWQQILLLAVTPTMSFYYSAPVSSGGRGRVWELLRRHHHEPLHSSAAFNQPLELILIISPSPIQQATHFWATSKYWWEKEVMKEKKAFFPPSFPPVIYGHMSTDAHRQLENLISLSLSLHPSGFMVQTAARALIVSHPCGRAWILQPLWPVLFFFFCSPL